MIFGTFISSFNNAFYSTMSKLPIVGGIFGHTINAPANVKAFLMVIRKYESSTADKGYRMMYGGKLFDSFKDHPNQVNFVNGIRSNAAGAYQFMAKKDGYGFPSTWNEAKAALGLTDFSPSSQDQAAIYLIKRRNAYDDLVNGRISSALDKLSYEWASLPSSDSKFRYPGQGSASKADVLQAFQQFGGTIIS